MDSSKRSERKSTTSAHLWKIPEELFCIIYSFISNKEIKQIRLANRECSNRFHINKFERVYISPNGTNLEAFYAVLDPLHRTVVKEIVWDDALFGRFSLNREFPHWVQFMTPDDFGKAVSDFMEGEFGSGVKQFALAKKWFMTGVPPDQDLLSPITLEEIMSLYHDLHRQQELIVTQGRDAIAFRKGLAGFPALRRITLTSEAHRPMIHRPYHKTPMIRSLPLSFIYPCPLPWRSGYMPWRRDGVYMSHRSHGMSVIHKELNNSDRSIPGFVIGSKFEDAGMMDFSSGGSVPYYEDFENFVKKQGLRRLELAIDGK
jgi:hypothetical protein